MCMHDQHEQSWTSWYTPKYTYISLYILTYINKGTAIIFTIHTTYMSQNFTYMSTYIFTYMYEGTYMLTFYGTYVTYVYIYDPILVI